MKEQTFTQIIKKINKFAKTNKTDSIQRGTFVYRSDTKQLFHIPEGGLPTLVNDEYLKKNDTIRVELLNEFSDILGEGSNSIPKAALELQPEVDRLTTEYARLLDALAEFDCRLRKTKEGTFVIEKSKNELSQAQEHEVKPLTEEAYTEEGDAHV